MVTKIKIVRIEHFCEGSYFVTYDTYQGFTGIPSTLPFMTKWIPDKLGLSEDAMLRYMRSYVTVVDKVKIIIKSVKQW